MSENRGTKIKDLYAQWAPSYDQSFHSVAVVVEEDELINLVNLQPEEKILDIGCGTGRVTQQLYAKTTLVTGIDISSDMLNIARSKLPGITFKEANIEESIPFDDMSFDKVVSSLVFQFIEHIEIPLQEIYRILKPGGSAYITTFISDAPLKWSDIEYKEKREKTIPSGSVQSISIFHPLDHYLSVAKQTGFSSVTYKTLIVNAKTKEVVTNESWKKIEGSWASIVLLLEK